jgi:hypothetical protein
MNRKTGDEIDTDLHMCLLSSFTKFIEDFSPLLDIAETYQKNILAENLINHNDQNVEKLQIINETITTLNEMIPSFFKIAKLEDKLEKYQNN